MTCCPGRLPLCAKGSNASKPTQSIATKLANFVASYRRRPLPPQRPSFNGILQTDAYAGYKPLYELNRGAGAVTEALCWSHARRKSYELTDIARNRHRGARAPPISPLALEAVRRIDELFDIERAINGLSGKDRWKMRQARARPLVESLESWRREEVSIR